MNNKFFPSNFMFMIMMILGTIMSLSSSHWLMMWMGLELNLMGILPLMNIKTKNFEIESSMKYFIIQSLSSSLFIMTMIIMYLYSFSTFSMFNNTFMSSIMMLSLLIKLGSSPFHMWLPAMCKHMSWMTLYLILTWQKLAPLFMLSFINFNYIIIIMCSLTSAILGSIQAINQSSLQMIMVYSSISHLGWMLCSCSINNTLMFLYLLIYSMIIFPLFINMNYYSNHSTYSLTEQNYNMNKQNIFIIMLILSLGGMPPMMGFLSKLMILYMMTKLNMLMLPLILFMSTLISLYFYLNLTMMMMIKSFFLLNINKMKMTTKSIMCLNMMSTIIFIPMMMYAMNILNKP
uniref:NADH-ubiquinone oxidoreductase chain 2 n=1 Tax=Enteroctopus dofleini TaxID=267067 RepID=A0A7T6C215_ENTDO|nr:NADH dehydrogenase subunit 2 [Enteroctopus dofleini]QQH14292.1 NADH dehydrogenase subunit 2 [Enteroctopus dofleini]WIA66152.1 NADH dehydrogenase subunit 2 [Enteroctopus dofleini]